MNERAMDIYNRHNNGESFSSIAESYGISRCRASQIFNKTKMKVEALNTPLDLNILIDFLYIAAEKLGIDHSMSIRTYNCLRRYRIRTVEDFMKTTDDELLQIRNMGPKSVDFCLKAKEVMACQE